MNRSFVLRFRSQQDFSVNSRHLTQRTTRCGTWEPRIAPPFGGKRTARCAESDAGEDAGRSEGLAVMAGIQVITWHESELTSSGSLCAREFEEPPS